MPFIPHTDADVSAMLDSIGVDSIEHVFSEIPNDLLYQGDLEVGPGLTEYQLSRLMRERAHAQQLGSCYLGAGAYEHHIPAIVFDVMSRGEFLTAYTPYQAEASQGSLQLIYEYQSMMAGLMGMDASNASLYDGATALTESILMAVRAQRKRSAKILVPVNLHPLYRQVANSIVTHQNIELVDLPYDKCTGCIDVSALEQYEGDDFAACVIQQPNFFGSVENVTALTDWVHRQGGLVIACVNPTAMALLREPGSWGEQGADIVCGEAQPLGISLAGGGPYIGFICCRQQLLRQLPGRLVGRTVDQKGRQGFTLTLQAREQHIRRAKATSNICTNQGLMVVAATVYMSVMGEHGLQHVAKACHGNSQDLVQRLTAIAGVTQRFNHPYFHEVVLQLPKDVKVVLEDLATEGIAGGVDLSEWFPELENCLLLCVTETKLEQDRQHYQQALQRVLS